MTEVTDLAAYQAYKLFDAAGNAMLSAAFYDAIWSHSSQQASITNLVGMTLLSKTISLLSFHSNSEVSESQPHPLSSISYPGFIAIVNANLAYLVGGSTASAGAIGKFCTVLGEGIIDYANITHVYHPPSTFIAANSFVSKDNFTLPVEYQTTTGSTPALVGSIAMFVIPIMDTLGYVSKPISESRVIKPCQRLPPVIQRILTVGYNSLFLFPTIIHLSYLKENPSYRYYFLNSHQIMLANAPYLATLILLKMIKQKVFPFHSFL